MNSDGLGCVWLTVNGRPLWAFLAWKGRWWELPRSQGTRDNLLKDKDRENKQTCGPYGALQMVAATWVLARVAIVAFVATVGFTLAFGRGVDALMAATGPGLLLGIGTFVSCIVLACLGFRREDKMNDD